MIILVSQSVPSCSSLCGILSSMSMAHCTVACEKAMSASSSSFIICSTSFVFCLADFSVLTGRDGFGVISAMVGFTSAIASCCGSMATGVFFFHHLVILLISCNNRSSATNDMYFRRSILIIRWKSENATQNLHFFQKIFILHFFTYQKADEGASFSSPPALACQHHYAFHLFTCIHCMRWNRSVLRKLLALYVELLRVWLIKKFI